MTSISHMDVKFLWGNSNYDYVCSESLGNSGGILCIWEASIFKKINTTVSDNFIAIYGTWLPTNSKILFIAIYAPQQTSCKRKLWDYISNIVGRWNGESIIMGDFNEVRSSEERPLRLDSEVNIEKEQLMRFIVMGQKSLPDPTSKKKGRPYWGFVEMVTTNIQDIKDALKGEEYETKTRGHRHKPPARALGEGVYRILRHQHKKDKKMHTHLIYKLEFPSTEGEAAEQQPQEALKVAQEAQEGRNEFRGLKRKRKPVFPKHLQERFGKLRYHVVDPPDFLNYQGCEFLLISASDNIREELGVDVHEDSSCSDLINTFGALMRF
ncbi:putative beta-1,3-galactosyltransferase 19-like protein [Tanacetum coccineum]